MLPYSEQMDSHMKLSPTGVGAAENAAWKLKRA